MRDVINRPVFLKEVWMDFQDTDSLLLNSSFFYSIIQKMFNEYLSGSKLRFLLRNPNHTLSSFLEWLNPALKELTVLGLIGLASRVLLKRESGTFTF